MLAITKNKMAKTNTPIILALLIAMVGACSSGGGAVVAEVDGIKISQDKLREEMQIERSIYDSAVLTTHANFDAFRRQALERLVQEEVMLREAKRQGIVAKGENPEIKDISSRTLKEHSIDPSRWKEAQRRRAIIRRLIDKEVLSMIPVDAQAVSAYFAKNSQEFRDNTRYHARQILVDTREEAEDIRARLAKGEDFAGLAKKHSQSPDGERGGDLGYFDAAAYPEVFAEACAKLKKGEISEVIATPYGFQIFQLLDERPARQRSLEEVSDAIQKRLREEKVDEFYAPWLENLMAGAKIVIHEEALKEVRLES